MAYVKVETSVRTNKKFIVAGPAPSWLWVCGLTYAQDGLTDGFIPVEAIEYLGVKNARRLAEHLVKAELWEVVQGGWRIHDYLEHNKSAAEVAGIRGERRLSGSKGGRYSGAERRSKTKPFASEHVEANNGNGSKHHANPSTSTATATATETTTATSADARMDVCFEKFKAAYPGERKVFGYREQQAYLGAIASGKCTPEKMLAALENHKASAQWQDPSKIPNPRTWLEGERWNQVLPQAKSLKTFGDWKPKESA